MRPASGGAVTTLPRPLSNRRFTALAVLCVLGAILFEDALAIGGARPDFAMVLLVYGAIRWGAARGSALGFGLGLMKDSLALTAFGTQTLGMTLIGYAVGKLRDTLYLSAPAVDLLFLAGAKLLLDVLVLARSAAGSWGAFETRFFWEGPLAALYTAAAGGLLVRLLRRS